MKFFLNLKAPIFIILSIVLIVSGFLLIKRYETELPSDLLQKEAGEVSVYSCGEIVTFESVPERALSFDTNMTEMMLALGLEDKLVGYWVSGVPVGNEFQEQIEDIPLISEIDWPPPSMEVVLSFNPDFVFGAWEYNFSDESGVTPQKLAASGVKSYVLAESCVAVGAKPNESLESTYEDLLNLGIIFKVEDRAEEVINEIKGNIEGVQNKIGKPEKPLRGLYYGGGADAAFSAGKYAMASKLMKAVGAQNILGDVEDDWIPAAGWETIIERNPEFIMIDDTPWESAEKRIETLESLPQLESIEAIKEKRYIVFPWTYILPGVQIDKGVKHLAENLYPELF